MSLPLETREFQSTHPARGATLLRPSRLHIHQISIHAPREGCDVLPVGDLALQGDFNPRTPRGVRPGVAGGGHQHPNFNPRTPRGVRLQVWSKDRPVGTFQSTHPARGATGLIGLRFPAASAFQSTHPARGATCSLSVRSSNGINFNPRTPRGVRLPQTKPFVKTPSNFNPRTPRGVRQIRLIELSGFLEISIHAPREGCDSPHLR